jgi:hypothetical protein
MSSTVPRRREQHDVGVRVDQAGQQRLARQVDRRKRRMRALDLGALADRRDAASA